MREGFVHVAEANVVHTLSYPSRPAHPPHPHLKKVNNNTSRSHPRKIWRANELGQWRLREFSDLKLSFEKKKKNKVVRLRSYRRLTCPPLPPTRDHARLSCREAVKSPCQRINSGRRSQKRRYRTASLGRVSGTQCAPFDTGHGRRETGRHSLETC